MSARYDCTDPAQRAAGVAEAAAALRKGDLVVLPTDTVYGVAADAFSPVAVAVLQSARGGSRNAPPTVLVGTVRAGLALVEDASAPAKDLIDEFWPGALTLVLRASPTVVWDLGDTKGTVAVRMPLHPVALDVLRETGPLAVSGANRTGLPPATTAAGAEGQLGDAVAVYLDAGPCPGGMPSTIVDLTGPVPRLLRPGVIPADRLRRVIALIGDDDEMAGGVPAPQEPGGDTGAGSAPAPQEPGGDMDAAGAPDWDAAGMAGASRTDNDIAGEDPKRHDVRPGDLE